MKLLLIVSFVLLSTNTIFAKTFLSRQWSRSTLAKPHLTYRHLNRMSPLLTENFVIQGNGVDGIKVFNRNTGAEIWGRQYLNGVEGGAVIDGDNLYYGANNGYFYCVDVHSGRKIWEFKLNSESLTRPIVQGSVVYHITGNNTIYSFDKKTGQSLWVKTNSAKSNMTVRGQTAPVFDKGLIYAGFSDGTFIAVNAQNGRELWSKRIGDDKKFNDVDATAVVTDKCLLVSSYANSLYCLSKSSGSISWRHDVGGYNSVYVSNNKIYYPTVNNEIDILDSQSGKLLKKIVNVNGLSTEIVGLNSLIIYGESNGDLVVRNQSDLEEVGRFSPGLGLFARPTVDPEKGEVYFVSNDANLFRVDIKDTPDNAFQWGHEKHGTKK